MKRPRGRESAEPATRLPRPADYYSESGLRWVFTLSTPTPAARHARPGLDVWGWATRMHDGSGRKVVIVCCELGALGFVPDELADEMWKAFQGASEAFGQGFRATGGVGKLNGSVASSEGGKLVLKMSLVLHQRRRQPEAVITPDMVELWGIDRKKLAGESDVGGAG